MGAERRLRRAAERDLRRFRGGTDEVVVRYSPSGRNGLPKMSDTLVKFGEPLLSQLPPRSGPAEWRVELHLASLVWCGVVAGESRDEIVGRVRRHFPERDASLVDELIERKKRLFDHDRRSIVGFETYERDGKVQVMALSAS